MLFVYDELPADPVQQMREFPIFAVFENIETLKLNKHSYKLHIFLSKQGEQVEFPKSFSEFKDCDNYAGWGAIFGGKGKECSNCKTKQPFNIIIEIT